MAITLETSPRIIRRKQLETRLGLSRSTIYGKLTNNPNRPNEYDPTFPKPIRLGGENSRAVGWLESEVDAWLALQIEKSRSKAEASA